MCSARQLADAILPSPKLNVSLPTSLALFHSFGLRCAHLFSPPLRFPLPPGRSYLFSLSLSLFPLFISLSVFLLTSFLIEHLGSTLQGSILFLSFVIFVYLCILCLGLLADVSLLTFSSISTPLCISVPPRLPGSKNRCSCTSWIPNRKRV